MLTLILILSCVLGYPTIGRAYGKASMLIWRKLPLSSLLARLWFPHSCRRADADGANASLPLSESWVMAEFYGNEKDRSVFLMYTSLFWPVYVGFTLVYLVARLLVTLVSLAIKTIRYVSWALFVRFPEMACATMSAFHKVLSDRESWRRGLTTASAEIAPAIGPTLALPMPHDHRSEYLQVVRKRGELMVEMDRLKVKEAELAMRLGGPDEARKLLDLPGRKL